MFTNTVLILLAIVVVSPILLAAACGRFLLYHPTVLPPDTLRVLSSQPGWHDEVIVSEDGTSLVGLVRPPDDDAPWLLFFGGNAMGLAAGQSILDLVAGEERWGLAVWAYRGYDGSQGKPTEIGLHADALAQANYLKSTHGVGPERLLIIGQSLGTGIAARLAAHLASNGTPPAGLVLMSPYTSMAQVFDDHVPLIPVGWAAPDPYRTDRILSQLKAPVVIIHGSDDTLIRPEHGRAIKEALGDRAVLLELDRRSHNDLWEDPRSVVAIRELVERALPPPGPSMDGGAEKP